MCDNLVKDKNISIRCTRQVEQILKYAHLTEAETTKINELTDEAYARLLFTLARTSNANILPLYVQMLYMEIIIPHFSHNQVQYYLASTYLAYLHKINQSFLQPYLYQV